MLVGLGENSLDVRRLNFISLTRSLLILSVKSRKDVIVLNLFISGVCSAFVFYIERTISLIKLLLLYKLKQTTVPVHRIHNIFSICFCISDEQIFHQLLCIVVKMED